MKRSMLILVLLTLGLLGAAGAFGGYSTPSKPSKARKRPLTASQACPETIHAAHKARLGTWGWQDALQEPRNLAGYFLGQKTISCRSVRQSLKNWRFRLHRARGLVRHLNSDIYDAIDFIFGARGLTWEATNVAECETGHTLGDVSVSLNARNGQYIGIFQMGEGWETHTYAIWKDEYRYSTVIDQVRAADRYQQASGWQPWQCLETGNGLRY